MPGPKGDTEEDDGVLLGMIFDGEKMQSSLAVSHPPFEISECLRGVTLF